MVDDVTDGTHATSINTRIAAPLIVAGPVTGTVGIDDALGVRTQCGSIMYSANSVTFAWRRVTGIDGVALLGLALGEWIAHKLVHAGANRTMIHHQALSIVAAYSRTRVHAFLVDASQVSRAVRVDRALWSASAREW